MDNKTRDRQIYSPLRLAVRPTQTTKIKWMTAISIKQPWAFFIAQGAKTIETRIWTSDYRGPILICASKSPDREAMEFFDEQITPEAKKMMKATLGKAVATAEIVNWRKMIFADEEKALCGWNPKLYAIQLVNTLEIRNPFPVRGKLKLFQVKIPNGVQFRKPKKAKG